MLAYLSALMVTTLLKVVNELTCFYDIIIIQDPVVGGSLLLTYTTGYVTPLLLAASFAGALQVDFSLR